MSFWSRLFPRKVGLGYQPCGVDSRDLACSTLLERVGFAYGTLPEQIDLWDARFPIFDQGSVGSCAGCSTAQGLRVAFAVDGRDVPPLSPLFLYYNGRRADRPGDKAVTDSGTTLRSVMKQLMHLGVCPESQWPLTSSHAARPSWLAYRAAADYRGLRGYYRVVDVEEIRRALAARRPVVIGLNVDKAFLDADGPSYVDDTAGGAGGHAMLLTGYDKRGRFHLVNSWGEQWRGGKILVGESFVRRSLSAWAIDT